VGGALRARIALFCCVAHRNLPSLKNRVVQLDHTCATPCVNSLTKGSSSRQSPAPAKFSMICSSVNPLGFKRSCKPLCEIVQARRAHGAIASSSLLWSRPRPSAGGSATVRAMKGLVEIVIERAPGEETPGAWRPAQAVWGGSIGAAEIILPHCRSKRLAVPSERASRRNASPRQHDQRDQC
jgi:hypothetical protein